MNDRPKQDSPESNDRTQRPGESRNRKATAADGWNKRADKEPSEVRPPRGADSDASRSNSLRRPSRRGLELGGGEKLSKKVHDAAFDNLEAGGDTLDLLRRMERILSDMHGKDSKASTDDITSAEEWLKGLEQEDLLRLVEKLESDSTLFDPELFPRIARTLESLEKKRSVHRAGGRGRSGTSEIPETTLSKAEAAERRAVARPEDGIGFEYGRAEASATQWNRWLKARTEPGLKMLNAPGAIIHVSVDISASERQSFGQGLAAKRLASSVKQLREKFPKARIQAQLVSAAERTSEAWKSGRDSRHDRVAIIMPESGEPPRIAKDEVMDPKF